MRIDSSGNVGIGTNSPVNKLHLLNAGTTAISSGIANSGMIVDGGSGNAALNLITGDAGYCYVNFGDSTDSNIGRIFYQHTDNSMVFSTNVAERMRIDSSGNVGIGTTSPVVKLTTESGVARTSTAKTETAFFSSTDVDDFRFGLAVSHKGGATDADRYASLDSTAYRISTDTFAAGGSLVLQELGGNVGIGTTSPTSLLTVGSGGTANPASTVAIHNTAADEYRLVLTSTLFNADGRWLGLGFGYSDNYMKAAIIAEAKDSNARTNLHFCLDGNANNNNAALADSKMTITYGGNVGIGTTSPSSALDVVGDIEVSGNASVGSISTPTAGTSNFVAGVNAGNSIVSGGTRNTLVGDLAGTAITTGDYNVALGYAALDAEDAGSRATALGYFALSNQNTDTDSYNVAVGFSAGESVTTGVNNTLIGGLAGDAITTGASNNAFGKSALSTNQTGNNNAAFGESALAANTGSDNVAMGHEALLENTTGTDNVAVGYKALDANTTASENTAVGSKALGANTTGASNTAFGSEALTGNTTGASNTAVGHNSLDTATTASNNTAVGKDALEDTSTGADNTAVGQAALKGNTTGTKNVCIGFGAGDAITTGSNNTIIGDFAGTTTLADTIVLASGTTERMRINDDGDTRFYGDLIVGAGTGYADGTSINSAYLHSVGDSTQPACRFVQGSTDNGDPVIRVRHENTTAGNYIEFRTDENVLTGQIQDVSGTMQYQSASDSRLKENVESMTEGLTDVLAMNPVKFTWKNIVTENKTVDMKSAESRGFLAQELNEHYPWAVSEGGENEKENPWGVDYGKLTPVLVKAIQEQNDLIESLTARITALEG